LKSSTNLKKFTKHYLLYSNMKTITWNGVITSITSKVDKSLGLRVATPELSPTERAEFMEYQGTNAVFTLDPLDEKADAGLMIAKDRETKTPSQRLRNAIYALHQTKLEHKEYTEPDFQTYYNTVMEGFINKVKEQLEVYE